MFDPLHFWTEIASLGAEFAFGLRLLARYEAKSLIRQKGHEAEGVAHQVAQLARERGDMRAAKLWDEVARQVIRRQAAKAR